MLEQLMLYNLYLLSEAIVVSNELKLAGVAIDSPSPSAVPFTAHSFFTGI